ncbi:uncharacterized protein [Antedon mediterranea]|uniref:uncharacterized protein n=1 Tax=Antedon mediterranea TaxID=105859 RepID=UPI003AF60FC3
MIATYLETGTTLSRVMQSFPNQAYLSLGYTAGQYPLPAYQPSLGYPAAQYPLPAYQPSVGYPAAQPAYPPQPPPQPQPAGQTDNIQPVPPTAITTVRTRPNNYLLSAILVTLFCCCPFGLIGIIYSVDSRTMFRLGDDASAASSAKRARYWTICALVTGIIVITVFIIFVVAVLYIGYRTDTDVGLPTSPIISSYSGLSTLAT